MLAKLEIVVLPPAYLLIAVVGFLASVASVSAYVYLQMRRRPPPPAFEPDLTIDLTTIEPKGPPADSPILELTGLPVRLAVLVLAPIGRWEFPTNDVVLQLLDQMVPGLAGVFASHETIVRRWPPQFSPRGFSHLFFAKVKLPGDRGRGTPWCSVSGKLHRDGRGMLVGMVFCTDGPNGLADIQIEQEHQWPEKLRVRT